MFSNTAHISLAPIALAQGQSEPLFYACKGRIGAWPFISALITPAALYAVSEAHTAVLPLLGFCMIVHMGEGWMSPGSTVQIKRVVKKFMLYMLVRAQRRSP